MDLEPPAKKKFKTGNLNSFIKSTRKTANDSSKNESESKIPISLSPLKWKKVKADNLDLDFCSQFYLKEEADELIRRLETDIEYFTGDLAKVFVFGKWHNVPRKQATFGEPGLSYKFSGISAPSRPWPKVLLEIKEKVSKACNKDFNFVLVNRYNDGNDYMAEHRDNEKELDPHTPIASLSFGQARDFIFTHGSTKKKDKSPNSTKIPPVKFVLNHGSLLLMNHPTNIYWYHSLPRRKTATGVRINLTFRKVIKSKCS